MNTGKVEKADEKFEFFRLGSELIDSIFKNGLAMRVSDEDRIHSLPVLCLVMDNTHCTIEGMKLVGFSLFNIEHMCYS